MSLPVGPKRRAYRQASHSNVITSVASSPDGQALPEGTDPTEDVMLRGTVEQVDSTMASPPRYRSLLVPVDGSPFGEHALPLALGIARRAGADIRVVHVHLPLEPIILRERIQHHSGLDAWLRRRQQEYLDGLIRRLARVTTVPVRPIFMEGCEITASLEAAARSGADLIVMASHGRGPLARLWCGNIADGLMRRLSIPLLLVRGYEAPADLAGDPLMRHVLVPLDGSELAERVLEPAVALGTLMGADHTLLHVAPLVTDSSVGYGGGSRRPPGSRRQAEMWTYLRRVADRPGARTLRVHPRVVLDEQPTAASNLRYARAHDVDLIALATRGRGGLSRLLRGGVADRVARGASVPVLVFRPADEPGGGGVP
jgi:nucleotide-binding universal stress UspA family protein